ncbi:hypothetical protein [Streptomyces recifensis]|uniref:hypothetical protein n=1 Tax=Streptomyces recifensis TaxID=67355 RepID=UPI000A379EA4|nr:hypothetical protein [Streptomyces recifensis]
MRESRSMRVRLLTLESAIAGLGTGIFVGTAGAQPFYQASVAGASGALAFFGAGMLVLTYTRE